MARDHARIRLDIWNDDDFRALTSNAQWLYMHMLTTSTLSFAGVADWRPARIAALTADLTANDVEHFANELEAGRFLVIDRDSEEALVRSFVKHDGLLRTPNMAKAFVKAFSNAASRVLRGVIVHELQRLETAQPDLSGWHVKEVEETLQRDSFPPSEAFEQLPENPSVRPSVRASVRPSPTPSNRPSATPSTRGSKSDATLPNSLTPFLPNSLPSSSVGTKPSPENPPASAE